MTETEIKQLKDYVLLMNGAPAIEVDLSAKELTFCVERPIALIEQRNLTGVVNNDVLIRLLQEGANAIGKYIIAKKRFNDLNDRYVLTPEEDGFSDMTQADVEWTEFMGKLKYYSYSMTKNT